MSLAMVLSLSKPRCSFEKNRDRIAIKLRINMLLLEQKKVLFSYKSTNCIFQQSLGNPTSRAAFILSVLHFAGEAGQLLDQTGA